MKHEDGLVIEICKSILAERQPLFSDSIHIMYVEDGDVGLKTHDGFFSSCVDIMGKVSMAASAVAPSQSNMARAVREQLTMWLAQAEQNYVTWKRNQMLSAFAQKAPARVADDYLRGVRLGEHNPGQGRPAKDGALIEDIRAAINRHSRESRSNTPDYVLAEYLMLALESFECGVRLRSRYRGEDTAKMRESPTAATATPMRDEHPGERKMREALESEYQGRAKPPTGIPIDSVAKRS